jgi:hypothetical protein
MTAVMASSVFLLVGGAPVALRHQGQVADVRLDFAKLVVTSDCSGSRGIQRIRAATAGGIWRRSAWLDFRRRCVGWRGARSKTQGNEDEWVSSLGL